MVKTDILFSADDCMEGNPATSDARKDRDKIIVKSSIFDGIIIDIKNVKKKKLSSTYRIDLLFNSFQIVLLWTETIVNNNIDYSMDITETETILNEKEKNDIFNFLKDYQY